MPYGLDVSSFSLHIGAKSSWSCYFSTWHGELSAVRVAKLPDLNPFMYGATDEVTLHALPDIEIPSNIHNCVARRLPQSMPPPKSRQNRAALVSYEYHE